MCTRYDGIDMSNDGRDFNWSGGAITKNMKLEAGDTLQLGWHSTAWFRKEGNAFRAIAVTDYPTKGEVTHQPDLQGKLYSQTVTRAVASCTAAIVSRGNLFGFMHLDADTVKEHQQKILDETGQMLSTEQGPINLCVSRINLPEERRFSEQLTGVCHDASNSGQELSRISLQQLAAGDVNVQTIDRGVPGESSHKGHIEIGLANSHIHGPVIFGDIVQQERRVEFSTEHANTEHTISQAMQRHVPRVAQSHTATKSKDCIIL